MTKQQLIDNLKEEIKVCKAQRDHYYKLSKSTEVEEKSFLYREFANAKQGRIYEAELVLRWLGE